MQFIEAILDRRKYSEKGKSESEKYLKDILDNSKRLEDFTTFFCYRYVKEYLEGLCLALERAGKSKFRITTVGAVLEYKPTQGKIQELSDELFQLSFEYHDIIFQEVSKQLKYIDFSFSENDNRNKLIEKVQISCGKDRDINENWCLYDKLKYLCGLCKSKISCSLSMEDCDYLYKFTKIDSRVIKLLEKLQEFFKKVSKATFVENSFESLSTPIKELTYDIKILRGRLISYLNNPSTSQKSSSRHPK